MNKKNYIKVGNIIQFTVRGHEYTINNNDVIIFNGAVAWVNNKLDYYLNELSMNKSTFKELLKDGELKLIKKETGLTKYGIEYYSIK